MQHAFTVDAEHAALYDKGYQLTGSVNNALSVQIVQWECFL
jgi:hypothetical protein